MTVAVYRYAGAVTPSVVRAVLVAEVEVEEVPRDQIKFANENGGDFIEVVPVYTS